MGVCLGISWQTLLKNWLRFNFSVLVLVLVLVLAWSKNADDGCGLT